MTLPIATTFIALYAIVMLPLTAWVGLLRGQLKASRGHAQNAILQKRIRVHGNFCENAPVMALALGAAEMSGAAPAVLWCAILSFGIGRVVHYAFFDSHLRAGGMLLTQLPSVFLGLWCLWALYAG